MVTEIVDNKRSEDEPRKSKKKLSPEVGSSGLRRFSGYVQDDFDPQLNGFKAAAAYDEMRRNDPDVAAVLSAIEYVIHSIDWTVAPGGTAQADIDAANFLRECMEDMNLSWHDFISDICSMFPFGWAMFELVWKQRNGSLPAEGEIDSLYNDGRIGWGKVALRGQESLSRWEFDEKGEIKGMHQRVIWSDTRGKAPHDVFIPIEKCVLFRVKREKNNPEGWSILRPAYRPYFIKKNIEEIEVQGAEKDMVGTLTIRLPANADSDDKEVAMRILEDYHSGDQTGLLLPRTVNDPELTDLDWQAELLKSPGSKMVDTDKIINRCSVMITRTSLAQFLTLGQNKAGGSRALGESMMDLFQVSVNGHLDNIEGTINRFMVRRLFEMNEFPGMTRMPTIQHGNTGEMTLKDLIDSVTKLHNTGFPLNDPDAVNAVRKKLGFPPLDDDFLQQREEIMEQAQLAQSTPDWENANEFPKERYAVPADARVVSPDSKTTPVDKSVTQLAGKTMKPKTDRRPDAPDMAKAVDRSINAPVRKSAREWAEFLAQ